MRWRNQIYIHAKLLIVDDRFVLVTSSHVDDRSLVGDRDTEIGIFAYQKNKNGTVMLSKEIQEYRMALLSEHLGSYDEDCVVMGSDKCLEKLTRLSQKAQDLYMTDPEEDVEDDNKDRMIHLMPFPVNVTQEGKVGPLKNWLHVPDSPEASMEGETTWVTRLVNRVAHVSQRGDDQESIIYNRQSSLRDDVRSVCKSEIPGKAADIFTPRYLSSLSNINAVESGLELNIFF